MKAKTAFAWLLIFVIGATPAVLLLTLGTRDFSSVLFTLGQVAGLMGMTFFALTFILSTRARWIEHLFDGLDKVYVVHGTLGATSLLLLLAHPLLLVSRYLPDQAKLAATYLIPGGLLSVDFGIFALLGMVILIILTLYGTMRYHRWKVSHEFFGAVFVLAVLHVFLIRGNGSRDLIFPGYYVFAAVVSAIGIAGFLYSTIIRRFIKTRQYKIAAIKRHTDCWEVKLKPLGKPLDHEAGQFVFVKFHNPHTGRESHPFSIASRSGGKSITIIMKRLGDFTGRLGHLAIGDRVTVEGPYGRFHAGRTFGDEVWIAGGIGITPFLGLAEEFKDNPAGNVDLFYVARSTEGFVHLDSLRRVADANSNFRLHKWETAKDGRLTIKDLERTIAPLESKRFYLCGPDGLKHSITEALARRGILDVHDERFAFR